MSIEGRNLYPRLKSLLDDMDPNSKIQSHVMAKFLVSVYTEFVYCYNLNRIRPDSRVMLDRDKE